MASLNESSTDNWLGNDRYVSYIRLKPGHKAEEMAPYIDKMMEENVDMDAVRSAGVSFTYVPILLSERYTHDSYVRMMSWILGLMAFGCSPYSNEACRAPHVRCPTGWSAETSQRNWYRQLSHRPLCCALHPDDIASSSPCL